ncbi:hypothetical protein NUW58_g8274 [Xylaria curta]|uniref:Uncharacterized protein n=1 Tax=Xylaria curta TaxID=42375 RepID=A0ACC1NBA1_9PEZI|nr:hypothetical protein NUW58_g8274 [Xylaria curta]
MALSHVLLSVALFAVLSFRIIVDWSKLRKAPGPVLAGFTDLWRAYQQYNGRMREKLLDLHARHGPIVRYGVRCISISDPEVINIVYGSRAGFVTADSYKVLLGYHNGKDIPSLVSTRDEKQHGALRRSVANAFTPTAVLDYEKWIDMTIRELLESVARKQTFDLTSMILWYTMDAAARFSFGTSLGCLSAEDDVGGSIQLIRDRFRHWGLWSSYPAIERLVYRNSFFKPAKRAPSSIASVASARLKERISNDRGAKEGKDTSATPDLLQRFLEASNEFPQALDGPGIVGMLMSTISGAADTTASTAVVMLFYLLKNPEVLRKLEAELADAGIQEIPAFAEVGKLPYLNAVLRESMRVFTIGTFPNGAARAVHLNKTVFGEDSDVFRPERWLTDDREQLRLMEAAHVGFSRGRRSCLGQNIAVLSIKKVIPALITKFKLSLVDPDASLEADCAPAAVILEPIYVKSKIRV